MKINKLLPEIEDMKPINDWWKTFSETPFTKEFNELNFEEQLQVINDIIRQTMMYDKIPNPQTHVYDLIGDSYTASLAAIDYLKHLNIGKNHRCVLARKRSYDPDNIGTTHTMVLVDDGLGQTYQLDCSPYVGYKCGKVGKVDDEKFYEEYVNIDGIIKEYIEMMRQFIYDLNNNNLCASDILEFTKILDSMGDFDILYGYISYCYSVLSSVSADKNSKMSFAKKALNYNPYSDFLSNLDDRNFQKIQQRELILSQVDKWREELNDLIPTDKDFRRQLELAQNIVQELKHIYPEYERYLTLDNKKIAFSYISPRFFLENGLNVVLLKPSSFYLGVSATIKDRFLKKGNGILDESFPNVGAPSELTGIKPMRMFHPCGYLYERSMDGPGDLILVRDSAENIGVKKKQIRKELGKYVANQKVLWYDGKEMVWDPVILNLVHSTDDPCEASLHYLCAYPEHQLMTRFMYPNPVLGEYERKMKR